MINLQPNQHTIYVVSMNTYYEDGKILKAFKNIEDARDMVIKEFKNWVNRHKSAFKEVYKEMFYSDPDERTDYSEEFLQLLLEKKKIEFRTYSDGNTYSLDLLNNEGVYKNEGISVYIQENTDDIFIWLITPVELQD